MERVRTRNAFRLLHPSALLLGPKVNWRLTVPAPDVLYWSVTHFTDRQEIMCFWHIRPASSLYSQVLFTGRRCRRAGGNLPGSQSCGRKPESMRGVLEGGRGEKQ